MNLNLPSDLQRIAPFVAAAVVAVVGLVLVTRGVGGGSDGGRDAAQIVERAFSTSPKSGVLDLRLNAALEVPGHSPDSTTYSFKGPFTQGPPSEADVRVTEAGGGNNVSARIIAADGKGYLGYRGRFYELTPAQTRNALGGTDEKPFLQELGFNVQNWIVDPRVVGKARVDGIQVDHVKGKLNADAMLADIQQLGNADEQNAQGFAPLQNATKDGDVDIYVGTGDGIVREVDVTSRFETQANGTPVRATMRFDVGVSDVNKPQDIKAPANPLPPGRADEIPASRLGSLANQLRAQNSRAGSDKQSGGGQRNGSGAKTSPRSRQAYLSCVGQAADTAALEKCQAFAPRR